MKPTYGSSKKNVYDVTFNYLWACYRSLDERRIKRFCTLMKNSIEDGSIRSFMIECRDAIKEDRRKFKFYCNFKNGRHPHLISS